MTESSTAAGRTPDADEVAARLAISDVLARHCRGVDRADEAQLKDCYWPDATVAYGGFNGSAHEFCAILPASITRYTATQHTITNSIVERSGREARVETYVTAYHLLEQDREMTYLGRYLDQFEERDGLWKMKHRQVVMDWNQNTAATAIMGGPPFDGLARGARYPDDPLYQS